MTSSKKAVSLLTAAALVVAPASGVAANYDTAYAGEGGDDGHKQHADSSTPQSYDQAASWIASGKISSVGPIDRALGAKYITEGQHASLCAQLRAAQAAAAEATAVAEVEEEAAVQEEKAAKEAAAEEKAEKADADKADADKAEADTADTSDEVTAEPAGDAVEDGSATDEGDGAATDGSDTEGTDESSEGETPEQPGGGEGEGETPAQPGEGEGETPAPPTTGEEPGEGDAPATGETPAPETPDATTPSTPAQPGADTPSASEPAAPATPAEKPAPAPAAPVVTQTPEGPATVSNPVDSGVQKPSADGATPVTAATHSAAVAKGKTQTPLKSAAVAVPSISFTHMDNSAYVARHYSEDLTTEKFISLVGEPARRIADENDLYASIMIAQAILESASGNSTLAQAPNNNLFGIKGAYQGASVQLPTREDDGSGSTYAIMSDFRQYPSVNESLADYADLLSNSMGDFYAGAHKSNTESFVDAADFLVGRYATDIFYSEKLQDLIETYDLTRFDVPVTYEMTETFVVPVMDEVTGQEKMLDPVQDEKAYKALVQEYEEYLGRNREYLDAVEEWEEQTRTAEKMYNVPVFLEKPEAPKEETPAEQYQKSIEAERFEGFAELIEKKQPLPVREVRTLNDLTTMATSFLGVPYVWGGTTPEGFDCSGLVQYCYREVFGIELPRTTYYQCNVGVEVRFEDLIPGDLLFFEDGTGDVHHVAMYLGDGYYVEAPHTGDVVKITAMNDKLPSFAKRVVDVRNVDMAEFSDEELQQFVDREKYLQEREQRLGVTDESLQELTEWLQGLTF